MKKITLAGLLFALASAASAAVDPALLNLVMPDAKILSGLQVESSQSTPFGQYILSQMQFNTDERFQKFVTATGFDPRRDLHEILAATAGDRTNPHNGLILGKGLFQPATISAAATVAGGTVTPYRGYNLLTGPSQNSAPPAIAFLDSTTAAIGPTAAVKAVIDRRIAGATYTGPLAQKANTASASNHAWVATVTPLSEFLSGAMAQNPQFSNFSQSPLLQSVLETSGGINFGSTTVTISADALTSSTQNAQSLADVLKFLVGLVTNNQNNPGTGLANAATFTVNGPVLHISLALPEQQIEQLFVPHNGKPRKIASAK